MRPEKNEATVEDPSAICRQCLCPRRVVAEPCGSGSGWQGDSEHSRDSELTGRALWGDKPWPEQGLSKRPCDELHGGETGSEKEALSTGHERRGLLQG